MVDIGGFLSDPFTIRSLISIAAGVVTGLVVVRLTFHLRNQRDLFNAIRAIRAELDHDTDQLAKLAKLLQADMETHQVDRPITLPAGTTIEFRYVLTLPSSLRTAAFDQLRRSGQFLALPPDLRQQLFDLYDVIDRINRLHRHRESLHYDNLGHVHVRIETGSLDIEPGTTVGEADLPAAVRVRLTALRQLRQSTIGINRQILRLVAAICPPDTLADLPLGDAAAPDAPSGEPAGTTRRPPPIDVPDIATVVGRLDEIERAAFWARFV